MAFFLPAPATSREPLPVWFWLLLLSLVHSAHAGANPNFAPPGATWRWTPATTIQISQPLWRQSPEASQPWNQGTLPIGYGDVTLGTTDTAMRGTYPGLLLARTFELTAAGVAAWDAIELNVRCSGGFVIWLNGHEIARANVPDGDPTPGTLATLAVPRPVPTQPFRIPNPTELLRVGTNVLTAHAVNTSLGLSPDFLFDADARGIQDDTTPVVTEILPTPGSIRIRIPQVEILFSEPVTGLEAGDLLFNGVPATAANEVAPGDWVFVTPPLGQGLVTVSWAPNPGITDLASTPNHLEPAPWSYTINPNDPATRIVINEFMAENKNGLRDEDGETSDWIELQNQGTEAVDLQGWKLRDAPDPATGWSFPAVTLQPGAYLVIFASGKDRTNLASHLHTSFKLPSHGSYLGLVDSRGLNVSEFAPAYPAQRPDVSYGRVPGSDAAGFFTRPTPGQANATAGAGFAPAVIPSRLPGTFTEPFRLFLSLDDPSAVGLIRYTLDGSDPTNTSRIYAGQLTITNSAMVRARAYVSGLLPGPIHTASYILLSNNVATFTSDLPLVVLMGATNLSLNETRPITVNLSLFEPVNGRTTLTGRPTFSGRAGIRIRGSSSASFPKQSLAVELWDEQGQDTKASLLGLPAESDWILFGPYDYDRVLIHNAFMYGLSRDVGRYASRTRFVEVFLQPSSGPLSANRYNGVYVLEEKIKTGKDRVDIDPLAAEQVQTPEVTGGYLLKIDRLDPGDAGIGAGGQIIAFVDPKESELKTAQRAPQRRYITDFLTTLTRALGNTTTWTNLETGYRAYVDVPSWIDFHLLNTLSANPDAFTLSTYFHKPRNQRLTFGPIWDFDRTLGSTDGRDAIPRAWGGGGSSYYFTYGWWGLIFKDPDFFQEYLDRYQELRKSAFSTPSVHARIDSLGGTLRQAQARDRARWPLNAPRGGTYQAELDRMKNWLSNRLDFLDHQFVAPPLATLPAGTLAPGMSLTLTTPTNAAIYYTLNGTDPRGPKGIRTPEAQLYTSPIPLTTNCQLVARAYQTTHKPKTGGDAPPLASLWSGPIRSTLIVSPYPFRITELMFHPATGGEFIEWVNTGSTPVSCDGLRFTSGPDFAFPQRGAPILQPGEHALLVRDLPTFSLIHSNVPGTRILGSFPNHLSNANRRVRLNGPLGETILDFQWSAQWQPLADGPGFSLVATDERPGADPATPSNWRLSALPGGSPGETDPLPIQPPAVWINEVRSRTAPPGQDFVELQNPNPFDVDLSGWFLTDDFQEPRKFRIPSHTLLPASGYIVFTDAQFSSANPGFSLRGSGDSIHLFSATTDGRFTGWTDGFKLPPLATDETVGRILTSDGRPLLTPLSHATPGTTNAAPIIGPVILHAIHVHPPSQGTASTPNTLEIYIDLLNQGPETVALFDPIHPDHAWRLTGSLDLELPPGLRLTPNEHLVLTSFDPDTDTDLAARFRTRFGLDPSVQLAGPLRGTVPPTGGHFRLLRPDAPIPEDPSSYPELVVEEVHTSTLTPWPETTGGRALTRQMPARFPDDPVAWKSATPTPGDVDLDDNGLPDGWEQRHHLRELAGPDATKPWGDPDGDGLTNLEEWQAGTDPRSAASRLAILSVTMERQTSGSPALRFLIPAPPGRSITLLYRDSLVTGTWQPLRTVLVPGTATPESIPLLETPPTNARYYRLQMP